jgi:hypothetical protein
MPWLGLGVFFFLDFANLAELHLFDLDFAELAPGVTGSLGVAGAAEVVGVAGVAWTAPTNGAAAVTVAALLDRVGVLGVFGIVGGRGLSVAFALLWTTTVVDCNCIEIIKCLSTYGDGLLLWRLPPSSEPPSSLSLFEFSLSSLSLLSAPTPRLIVLSKSIICTPKSWQALRGVSKHEYIENTLFDDPSNTSY